MDTPTTFKCPRCQQNTLLDLRDTPFDIDNDPALAVCKACQQGRWQCHDCPHVKIEGAVLNDYCFLYGEPLALRVAVPSGRKKLLRTLKCRQEFVHPPVHIHSAANPK